MKQMADDFIIKVCGITSLDDAQASIDAGANALGFNFYKGSPRYITPTAAAHIANAVKGPYRRVGVFVNAPDQQVRAIVSEVGLDVVQLHGSMPSIPGLTNWRATQVSPYPEKDDQIEAYLLDTFSPGFGGSGRTFDWSLATNFPYRAIIAGGLDGNNVAEAIRIAEPWGVDSCSRLESHPGRKDPKRVAAFIDAAFTAFQSKQQVAI